MGLVRDRSLIPWDDDLDFVIVKSEDPNEKYINGEIAKYQVWDLKTPAVHGIHKEVISGVNVFIPDNSTEIL